METLTTELVEKLKKQGFKSFVCLGCEEGNTNEDYILVPSEIELADEEENMVEGQALLNFDTSELKDMIGGDEPVKFKVKLPV